MKLFYTIIILFFTNSAFATNYYFSSVSGNDSRSVSEAQNPSTPWKTLDKLNSFFSSLKPGDGVYLKRGETYYGSIIVKQSGSTATPIVIGAYGSGSKPVITSLVTLTDWENKGAGIWESGTILNSAVNMVLLNDFEQEMGRYPNSDAGNKGYLNFESHSGKTSITDNDLNTAINWTGAELVTRPRHWILNRSLITAHSGQKISYTTSSPYEPYENYGYFIQNSIKTLDKKGEWYYNSSTKKLSVYFGSGDPSIDIIQAAATGNDLVYSSGFSNVIFDNLIIKGGNSSGVFINNGSNIFIQNCDILFSGINGALVHGHTNLHIENCTISNSNNNGIDMEYSVNNAVIKNNKISNTALIPGLLQNGEGTGLAIYSNGDGANIELNELRATGFIGMTFYGSNVVIKNNFIDSFCFVKDDGGGIYTHGGSTIPVNRKLINNIITNGIGAGPGTDIYDKRSVTGIYIDANTYNVDITGNTVTTCHQGIFIQSTNGINIKDNVVYNNDRQLTIIQRAGNNLVRNNTIFGNIFFSKAADHWTSYIMSTADDIGSFASFDNNFYARPIDDRVSIYNSRVAGGAVVVENYDLAGWKKKYNKDASSNISAKQITPYKINSLTGSNKFINGGDFTNDIKGVSASSSAISLNTSGVLDGGCLQIIPSATGSAIFMKIGAVSAGKKYILSYSIRGSEENHMSVGASIKQTASPYTALTKVQFRKISTTRTENQLLFSPSISEASTNLNLKLDAKSKYYLDNIKVYEADAIINNADDSIRFIYNATNAVVPFSLTGNYMDVKGNTYSNSVALQPYTSIILIQTDGVPQNAAPGINITSPLVNASFIAQANIEINANAVDTDGSIAKVDFYNGSTLLGSDVSSPYSFSWNNVPAGSYSLTAKATDNGGLFTTSSPVSIVVTSVVNLIPPIVSISSPAINTFYTAPATIAITASASDNDGSITKVDFYNNSTLLGSVVSSPYSFSWNNVPTGNYSLKAIATDNDGLTSASSPVSISVTPMIISVPPVVSITAPAANVNYTAPATIVVSATATDAGGSIRKVEFFNGTTLLKTESTAPFTFNWQNVPAGNYSLTAKATDNDGQSTTSVAQPVSVNTSGAPVVNIITPAVNATYNAPATITISATATDANGSVSKVEFYNGNTLLKTESTAPYSFIWKNVPPGNYSIKAKATDNSGISTTTAIVPVKVNAQQVAVSLPAGAGALFNNKFTGISSAKAGGNNINRPKLINFRLFPNPAINTIQINIEGLYNYIKANLTLYNAVGAVIKRYPVNLSNQNIEVNVSYLSAGIYSISLEGDNFIVNKKFAKVK